MGRVIANELMSEAVAQKLLPDAEKADGTEVTGAAPSQVGWGASIMLGVGNT